MLFTIKINFRNLLLNFILHFELILIKKTFQNNFPIQSLYTHLLIHK